MQLIERISKPRALDPLGVSIFLSTGWVGSDHTLRCDIRVIPGGQRWTWQGGDNEPTRQTYYPPSRLARQPRQVLTPSYIKQLADGLIQPLRSLSQSFDNITCSLTGGLDSRLIAAMLIRAGLKAQYYTFGDPSDTDVKIATLIARTFDLPYKVTTITVSDVISDWDNTCLQTIQQADGMRSLYLASGMLKNRAPRIDRLDVILWGAGGEIARCFYGNPHFFLARLDVADIERLLVKKRNRDYGGLIRQEGVALVRGYIHRFIMQCVDDGFAPIDIPDLFGMYQGDARRVGNNSRGLMSCRDVFSPYCTRAFVDATFALPALQRFTEPLHYSLMRLLSPELHSMPSDKGPWPLQQPIMNLIMNLLKSYGTAQLARIRRRLRDVLIKANRDKCCSSYIGCDIMLDRKSWFEAKHEQLREVCLDQTNSSIWDFVDRSMFDRIMSSATDPVDRSRYLKVLCDIVTLFHYEADHRRYSDSATAKPPFES
ncbi:MAG: asparagine synthase-related protein [Pseudomonadota bacterium]